MMPSGQTICLCMIVKNEVANLERCLASVADHIACWVIGDTGSTDGTPDVIRRFFAARNIPGELHSFAFETFEQARNRALEHARASTLAFDYLLLCDADMELTFQDPAALRTLHAPAYHLRQQAGISYWNLRLLRRDVPAVYRGVTHEYLDLKGAQAENLQGASFIDHASGSNRVDKFERDARLLRAALVEEADPALVARYTFYLANTLKDAGDDEGALPVYVRRAALGYWHEEVYVSLLNVARLKEKLARPDDEVVLAYLDAARACRTRAEALHGAARYCRNHGQHRRGYDFAAQGLEIPRPQTALFSEDWIYDTGLLDEYAVNAYWAGEYGRSAEACRRLLGTSGLSFAERGRITSNLNFALAKLGDRAGPSGSAAASSRPSPPSWQPDRPLAGTELMVEGLRERLGSALDAIDLRVNLYDPATRDVRPLVVWFHHDIDQAAVQWCRDAALTEPVARFVFISYWQRERYVSAFGLRPERCVVIKYALEPAAEPRLWAPAPVYRCAYTSTPFRGLDVLLDVWDRVPAGRAELHVWSSMKLYTMDDGPYRHLMDRAKSTPGVVYHGLAPNAELRAALRTMHFLTYPNTFAETACLSVMEAMSAGCRVIVPSHGVLPETTGGYARVYPWSPDKVRHAAIFNDVLAEEFANPWDGRPAEALGQQAHCATIFAWERRLGEWRRLIAALSADPASASETSTTPQLTESANRTPMQTTIFRPTVRKIETSRGPFFITDQDYIGEQLETNGDWEPYIHDFAKIVLNERSNVIDLGANIGFHSVSFSRLAPHGEIFAFEPVNLCFSQLQMNLVTNGIDNVRAFKMAVTDRSGETVEMEALDATTYGNGIVNIANSRIGQGGDFTFTVRLDDMKFPKIDLVKIDIQGSEPVALRGMEGLISRDRPIFFVEIEEYHLRRSGSSSKELIEFFLKKNYNLLRIKTDWPADHIAIPRESAEMEFKCRAYNKLSTEWISGTEVELGFDNEYLYSTFDVK